MSDTTNTAPAAAQDTAKARGARKVLIGKVTSDKMDKTITVEFSRKVKHPLYEKFVGRRTRLHAHDEANDAKIGDLVEVEETRPLSKLKRWRLVRVVQRAVQD